MSSDASTVMPQIGSTAVTGAGALAGRRRRGRDVLGLATLAAEVDGLAVVLVLRGVGRHRHRHAADRIDGERRGGLGARRAQRRGVAAPVARLDEPRDDRQRDLGRRLGLDVQAGGNVDAREQLVGDACLAKLLDERGTALGARDEPDVGKFGLQAGADRLELALAVRRDDDPEVALVDLGRVVADGRDVEIELRTELLDRRGDRLGSHDVHARGRQRRLQEDLDCATGQAAVEHRDGAVLLGLLLARDLVLRRQDAKENGLAGLHRRPGKQPDAVLRADAADEALDVSVARDEGDVACVRARRALGAHDGRGRKRRALRGELFSSPRQRVVSHCGGCAFPFIAAHTRAGKHGMSMCLMPLAW